MSGIAIVDYGMANLRSVQKAFEKVGAEAFITSDADRIAQASKVVLPGVGAFRDAIARLRESGLAEPIVDQITEGTPVLGICLGLQLLFSRSYEDGVHAGLDVVPGDVVRFNEAPGLKIPHMGWNHLRFPKRCPLFEGLPEESAVYFVHSYYAAPIDHRIVSAEADYPGPFTAAIWQDNLFATQFHPEKSQSVGLTILRNFARI
jgi:imidazole glycerol-phosphate synthase subunit HisH